MTALRVATRGSALALWQARHVAARLRAAHDDLEVVEVIVETEGDRNRAVPIGELGGRGVFTKEVQLAVLDGRADIAVHSAKDLPSSPDLQPDGLVLAAFPTRADARDALVGSTLDALRPVSITRKTPSGNLDTVAPRVKAPILAAVGVPRFRSR